MKLYANIESDRAKKAQGGNKYIRIHLRVGDASISRLVATLCAEVNGDSVVLDYGNDAMIESLIHTFNLQTKGEKQKGETIIVPIQMHSEQYERLRAKDEGNW